MNERINERTEIMKKIYNQPTVEVMNVCPTTPVLVGSPGTLHNSGSGTGSLGGGEIIGG